MERLLRWRRTRKDYTQVVEFPVEIVGRDGHVRRFSFDDSVRLYQRRILSAPLRYDDPADVVSEENHCRQRIEQLRRSYLEHFGWGPFRGQLMSGSVLGTPLAAEVVSFLRRVFGEEPDGIASMLVTPLEVGLTDTCFVQTAGRAFLLYAWRLDVPAARDACAQVLARMSEAPSGEGVERLLVRWSSADVVVALTGTGTWPDAPVLDEVAVPLTGDAWLDGMRALYDGQIQTALLRLEQGLESHPARKVLAQTSALVALLDGQPERAGFDARSGLLYHPKDALLRYCEALSLCRLGRFGDAEVNLRADLNDKPLLLLHLLLRVRAGEWGAAVRLLWALRQGEVEARFVHRASWIILGWMAQSLALVGASIATAAVAIFVLQQGNSMGGAILLACSLGLLAPVPRLLGHRADLTLAGKYKQIPLVSPELFPRERRGEPAH